MRSNCHIWAWSQMVRRGGFIAFRKTQYAALGTDKPEWWWRPMWALGVLIQHIGAYLGFLGWLLRWRSWYHCCWVDQSGQWWEFVPVKASKSARYAPPLVFTGEAKKVIDEEKRDAV